MNPHAPSDSERAEIATRLAHEQRTRFGGSKKAAYTAAAVNPATWDRALAGERVRADRLVSILANLWPESGGDWQAIPDTGVPHAEPSDLERRLAMIERRLADLERERGEHGGDTAATSTPGETLGTVTKLPQRGQDLDQEAARDVGRDSEADRGRRQQNTAGEPPADDPTDVEPR